MRCGDYCSPSPAVTPGPAPGLLTAPSTCHDPRRNNARPRRSRPRRPHRPYSSICPYSSLRPSKHSRLPRPAHLLLSPSNRRPLPSPNLHPPPSAHDRRFPSLPPSLPPLPLAHPASPSQELKISLPAIGPLPMRSCNKQPPLIDRLVQSRCSASRLSAPVATSR